MNKHIFLALIIIAGFAFFIFLKPDHKLSNQIVDLEVLSEYSENLPQDIQSLTNTSNADISDEEIAIAQETNQHILSSLMNLEEGQTYEDVFREYIKKTKKSLLDNQGQDFVISSIEQTAENIGVDLGSFSNNNFFADFFKNFLHFGDE